MDTYGSPEDSLRHDPHAVLSCLLGLARHRVRVGDHEDVEVLRNPFEDNEAGASRQLLRLGSRDRLTAQAPDQRSRETDGQPREAVGPATYLRAGRRQRFPRRLCEEGVQCRAVQSEVPADIFQILTLRRRDDAIGEGNLHQTPEVSAMRLKHLSAGEAPFLGRTEQLGSFILGDSSILKCPIQDIKVCGHVGIACTVSVEPLDEASEI